MIVPAKKKKTTITGASYHAVLSDVVALLEASRRAAARSVNSLMTSTYWLIGKRIVEQEQRGKARADYGDALLRRLAGDLTARLGRGFSERNLEQMRKFYQAWPISQTLSAEFARPRRLAAGTKSAKSADIEGSSPQFPLPWSHYVRLLSVRNKLGRQFYETEALRGGWTARQLDRQIQSQFFERTALSRNKVAILEKGMVATPADATTPEEEIKDPFVLEFLGLKDEYSETELEDALIKNLETFLLELGGDFAFVARQRRLRIDDVWYRVDLVFYHRALRCLVIIDLKLGTFTHADAGQMHLYLNYAREHWTRHDENPPIGLILCSKKSATVVKYALAGLSNKVIPAEYRTALPSEEVLAAQLEKSTRLLVGRLDKK